MRPRVLRSVPSRLSAPSRLGAPSRLHCALAPSVLISDHATLFSDQILTRIPTAPHGNGRWLVLLSPASSGDPGGYRRGPAVAVPRRCAQLPAGSVSWRVCLADLANEWTGSEAHLYASGDAVGPVRVDGVAPAGACYLLLRGAGGPSPLLEPRACDFLCIVHGLALTGLRRGPRSEGTC